MRSIHFTIVVCVLSFSLHTGSCGFIPNFLRQAIHTTVGVIKDIPKRIPTPSEIFEFGKTVLIGLPSELTFNVIHELCATSVNSQAISVKDKHTPQIANMSFILHTLRANTSIPITNPAQLWAHRDFNRYLPLVIFVTGWKTNLQLHRSEEQDALANAYLCRGNVNFVTIDTAAYIDTLYAWSALNTEVIGQYISEALQILVQIHPPSSIHLIGHSLGAQICGASGRLFNEATGLLVRRITGLDPANPCFSSGSALSGLSRGDAEWVDIIHTNPAILGKKEAIGDVDFYPNGMSLQLQPGTYSIISSHARAWQYYAESVYPGNEYNFLAKKCTSLKALDVNNCHGSLYPMGYATPHNLKGIFFLRTNSEPPYGKNSRKYHQPTCAYRNPQRYWGKK